MTVHWHPKVFHVSQRNYVTSSESAAVWVGVSANCIPGTPNAGLSKFKFRTGKTHRLRLINAGAEGIQRFTIDHHTMTVMANDFVPVRPYDTKVVTLGVSATTGSGRIMLSTLIDWSAYRRYR